MRISLATLVAATLCAMTSVAVAQTARPPILTPWRTARPLPAPQVDAPRRAPIDGLRVRRSALMNGDVAVLESDPSLLVDLGPAGVDLDDKAIAAAFYETWPDDFDYLVIFTDFPVLLAGGSAAGLYIPVASSTAGLNIGRNGQLSEMFDFSENYGSGGRLKGVIFMGNAGQMPSDPFSGSYNGGFSVMNILGQETLHQFGAFVGFEHEGAFRTDLLGRSGSHWSFFFHTSGSDLEGNNWTPRPERGDFLGSSVGGNFSQLDQYLMGLRLPEQLTEPMFLIDNPVPVSPAGASASTGPVAAGIVNGARLDVSIDQIIAAHGARNPTARTSQKIFSQAFIMVSDGSDPDNRAEIGDRVERFRRQWSRYFYEKSDSRGRILSTLDARDDHPAWRFVISDEGWTTTGATVDVGLEVGALILKPTETRVLVSNDNVKLATERIRFFTVEATVEGASADCALAATLRWVTTPGGTPDDTTTAEFALATDGQRHTYTVAPPAEFDGNLYGLALDIALPDADLGKTTVTVHLIEGSFLPTFPDVDGDGIIDAIDNCAQPNPVQTDVDGDGVGDACNPGATACVRPAPSAPSSSDEGCGCSLATPARRPASTLFLMGVLLAFCAARRRQQRSC